MIKYYKFVKGGKVEINKKEAIQLLSEYYSDTIEIASGIAMSVCNYDRAEKKLKSILSGIYRNNRGYIINDLYVYKEMR